MMYTFILNNTHTICTLSLNDVWCHKFIKGDTLDCQNFAYSIPLAGVYKFGWKVIKDKPTLYVERICY